MASLSFKVRRNSPEKITPAKPTPKDVKLVSDIDDQDGIRVFLSLLFFYKGKGNGNDADEPARVVRKALARTLVYYYPFAGQLKEGSNRKLMVEFTGDEGAVFVQAEADVSLEDFGDLQPPFPSLEELLPPIMDGSSGVINTPLLLVQVTRLKYGSFVVGIRFCHVMCEGIGMTLFLRTLAEFARGANASFVPPVWDRNLLTARNPPCVTHPHPEYDKAPPGPDDILPLCRQFQRSFFFAPSDISTLRGLAPPDIRDELTDLELIASVLWRCRTFALNPDPKAERRIMCAIDVRPRLDNPPLPKGYYGDAFALPVAIADAGDILSRPLESLMRQVHEANVQITDEYVRSMIDLLVIRGRPSFALAGTYLVSDVWLYGLDEVDFGWGKPLFCGPPTAGLGEFYGLSYFVPYTNKNGVAGTLVPVILPSQAVMEKFAGELARILGKKHV